MSLMEQRDKFMKQQEKCQSTLSSIASSRPVISKPSVSAGLVKFSDNIKRLQDINTIRNGCVESQMKCVIDLLFKTRQVFTIEQINEACYVDMHANKDVFRNLRNNPKVNYDGRRFSYKPKHNVKDKRQLLLLINKYPSGIGVIDLNDAYPNVIEDLQALKASQDIWYLSSADSKEDIVYPNDFKVEVQVDEEFKTLFRDIDIPSNFLEVEKEMLEFGLKPVTNTEQRRATEQIHGLSNKHKEKKKQEISKRTKLTNAHLPELFQSLKTNSSRN